MTKALLALRNKRNVLGRSFMGSRRLRNVASSLYRSVCVIDVRSLHALDRASAEAAAVAIMSRRFG